MPAWQIDLPGAVVVVTGGARGIGKATAELCAAHGADVCIGDLDGEAAVQAAGEIGDIGPRVHGQPLDVTVRESFAPRSPCRATWPPGTW